MNLRLRSFLQLIIPGALYLIAWLYLFLPTSAPLRLNGLPLDQKAELLVFIALSLSLLIAFTVRYLIWIGLLSNSSQGRQARGFHSYLEIAAIFVLLTLLVFKLFFPESRQLTACYQVPGINDHRCVWLAEGFRLDQPDQVSRFEESIAFAESGRPWRLASLNDARVFNVYGHPEGTLERRIQDLRKNHSYPFSATFRLGDPIVNLLQAEYARGGKISLAVTYSGAADFSGATAEPVHLAYSAVEHRQLLEVPATSISNLSISYKNFRCLDAAEDSTQCAQSLLIDSLSLETARLNVKVIHPDGREISLGYAPMLASGRHRFWFLGLRVLEVGAGVIVALLFLLRMYAYFPFRPGNANQIALAARAHLKAIFQLTLVSALGAFLIRAFYYQFFTAGELANGAKLTILIPLGAAYVSLFWMILFSKSANQLVKTAVAILGPGAFIVALSPFLVYLGVTLCLRVAPMNDVGFLNPGDDPLVYATNAMGILENGAPRTGRIVIGHYLVKPFFLHAKALYYAVFGGGEIYYGILITTAYVVVWSLFLVFSVLALSFKVKVKAASGWILRIAIAAGCASAYMTLSRNFLSFGGSFAEKAFTEGPAWLFASASFVLLLTLTDSTRPAVSLWLSGALFAGSLFFRSQYVMFLPLLVFVCAFLRPDQTWKKILLRLCLPAPLMGALLLFYFSLQSPIRDRPRIVGVPAPFAGMSARDFVGQQARFLFPGYWEFLSAVIFLSLLVWIWVGEGATKRLIFLILAFVATIFILDGLLGGNYGYYPRHIVMAFFLTSCGLMALIQDRFATREAINAHGARSP